MSAQQKRLDLRVALGSVSSASTRPESTGAGSCTQATIHTNIIKSGHGCRGLSIGISITREGGVASQDAGIQARLQMPLE